jgi:far upstream element-binding protein
LNGTLNENYNGSSGSHYGPTSGGNGDSEGAEIPVPRALVGYIIGRGGETIRELQMKSGAHIQIQREEENAPPNADRIVSISGSEDTIEVAKKLIQNLIDERMEGGGGSSDRYGSRYAPGSNPDGTESIELEIPNERVGLIIGRGGTTIKSIQSRTGANVNIPQAPEPNNPQIRLITITGNADQKEAAKAEILAILSDNGIGGGASAGNAIYMQVPNERVGVIIGKKGETIKGIQERYGVRVQIPQVPDAGTNPPIRTICIQGPPEYLQSVKAEIDAIILQGAGGGNSHGAYGSQTTGYYGYDQYAQYGGYTQEQYEAYYQQYYQQQTAAAGADGTTATAATVPGTEADANAATSYTSVDPNATTANGVAADGIATPTAAEPTDPNDPNAYWNGFYEYAAYYGIEAANAAWGVTGQAALDSIESYKQYQQQQAATGADPAATAAVSSTGAPPGT